MPDVVPHAPPARRPTRVAYHAPGWGRGELWLDATGVLLWHEAPTERPVEATAEHPLAARMRSYFAGASETLDDVALAVDDLSSFHRQLLRALRQVKRGRVVTYGELAAMAGRPRAARAAGTFCAQNRFPVIVPCHRVVASDGIGSYGHLGSGYKLRLLALEGWHSA